MYNLIMAIIMWNVICCTHLFCVRI